MLARRSNPRGFGSTTYSTTQNLMVPEVAMRVNRVSNFHHIMQEGQWVVSKLDFGADDKVTLRCRVMGTGFGHLYASFNDNGQPQILAIKRVTPGFHDLDFVVPYNVLKEFKVGVSTTIPSGYGIDLLTKSEQYRVRTNSMTMNQSPPMYETPGIGFPGFGAVLPNINQQPQGSQYWNGSLENFSWADAGYSGKGAINTASGDVPEAFGSYHGYYAHRASYYIAKFDDQDKFLGWGPLRGTNMGLTVPAGVPLCVVMQHFVLPEDVKRKRQEDARSAKDASWRYAGGQGGIKSFRIVHDEFVLTRRVKAFSDTSPRPQDGSGPIKTVPRGFVVDHFDVDEQQLSVDDIASSVEWYDESSGSWSSPMKSPSNIPAPNLKGLIKLTFRFPRQLSMETDKDVLEELNALGVNYNYNDTKTCYPTYSPSFKQAGSNTDKGYTLIGRPKDADTVYQENGSWFIAPKINTAFSAYFEYQSHPRAGVAGNDEGRPKPGYTQVNGAGRLQIQDSEKMARMNNPELYNAFYPLDGFKTGSIVIALGRGLSTSSMSVLGVNKEDPLLVPRTSAPIGSNPAAYLKPTGLILSTDLGDTRVAPTEERVLSLWSQKFGKPLTKSFFSTYSLPEQIPEEPHMYRARDPESGLYYKAPYQIMYFEIPQEYSGPYVSYKTETVQEKNADGQLTNVTKLVVTKEDMPYSLDGKGSLHLSVRTPYGYTRTQKIEIVSEVTQQVALADAGFTPEEQLAHNELDYDSEDYTDVVEEARQEQEQLDRLALLEDRKKKQGGGDDRGDRSVIPTGRRYVRSSDRFKLNPKHYARASELEKAGLLGSLGAFTDSRAFYVEDVTQKWGTVGLAGYTQGLDAYDTHTELVPMGAGPMDDFAMPPAEYAEKQALDVLDVLENLTMAAASGVAAARHASNFDAAKAEAELVDTAGYALNAQKEALDLGLKTVARTPRLTAYAAQSAANRVEDYMPFAGYRGLGDSLPGPVTLPGSTEEPFEDKTYRWGRGGAAFGKGALSKLFEGTVIKDKFNERPLFYSVVAGTLVLMGTGLGGGLIKTASQAVKASPEVAESLTEVPGAAVSGLVSSSRRIGNALVPVKKNKKKTRATATRRRASRKR